MKKLALLLTCFITTIVLRGQVNNFNSSPVTLQSPQAVQFIRYGDVPVDYSTGVPNISIPLYKVSCGSLSLPIDISYNASGIKVQDIAGTAGLGWSLNAGGLVSRTIMGTDDQQNRFKPFLSSDDIAAVVNNCHNNLTYNNVQSFVETVNQIFTQSTQQKESQSDRFFYSFNGRSGIFRTDFQTGVAKTVPYSALKISTGTNNAGPYKITAEDGTNYYFEQAEMSGSNPGYSFNTSFYLTKIESSDLTHTINIYYKQDVQVSQFIKNYTLEHIKETPSSGPFGPTTRTDGHDNEFVSESIPVMPDSITSDNETILFQYIADRPDLRKSRLSSIKILNRISREIIKLIEFKHSYFGTAAANNQRLRLDSLNLKDNNNTTVQQYGFGYNSSPLPPYYHSLGMSEHHNVDYWGYYNGADNVNLLPAELFDPVYDPVIRPFDNYFTPQEKSYYGGNRNPNPQTAQACILTEVKYPTGGKSNFEYELNQVASGYSYLSNGENYGGLRVKTISSTTDAASTPVIKTYKYTGGFHTMIESEMYQQYSKASTKYGPTLYQSPPVNVTTTSINTDPLMPMSTGSGPLVIYDKVTEYDGTEANNNGYIEYSYDNSNIPYFLYDPGTAGNPLLNGYYLSDYGNYKPQLVAKIFYGKDQNNIVKEIKREELSYNTFNSGSFITGVKIQRDNPFVKTGDYASFTDCDVVCSGANYCQQGLATLLSYYTFSNTTGVLDVPLLVQKKETIHPSNGTGDLITTTGYTYDLVTLQPIKEQSINSKGETIISLSKYPTDFSSAAPYNTMVARNILTPVIEQFAYKNNISSQNFLQSSKTNYDFWNGTNWSSSATNIIVPRTVDTRSKDQPGYETRLRYYSYDNKGNITTFSKENDIKKTYLWGYNKIYPVAEIIGADDSTARSYINQSILDNPADDASLRSHLSNLRNIPNALVKTYSYKPLVGMTSETDPNGKTIYYQYDAFNRLILIKDKDNNILKKICYNYAGQPENCTLPCTDTTANWQNTTTAIRCQQGSCGNTGYQEQEQKDMNVCSPTYNRTQWVLAGYNPTACAAQTCATITSTNTAYNMPGYIASYYNITTGYTYNFIIPATSGLQTLGTIPMGTYNLTISKPGGAVSLVFKSGCRFQTITGSSAVFSNISVSSMSCNSISIANDLSN